MQSQRKGPRGARSSHEDRLSSPATVAARTEHPISLDALRRKVARLEARRDELAARLGEQEHEAPARQRNEHTKPAPPRDAVEPEAEPWPEAWTLGNRAVGVALTLTFVAVGVLVVNPLVRIFAGAFALIPLLGVVRPPKLTMDEQGVAVRGLLTQFTYRWTEIFDFHASRTRNGIELKTAYGWETHGAMLTARQRFDANACAQAWIAASHDDEQRKKRKKRKKRRSQDADGVS